MYNKESIAKEQELMQELMKDEEKMAAYFKNQTKLNNEAIPVVVDMILDMEIEDAVLTWVEEQRMQKEDVLQEQKAEEKANMTDAERITENKDRMMKIREQRVYERRAMGRRVTFLLPDI